MEFCPHGPLCCHTSQRWQVGEPGDEYTLCWAHREDGDAALSPSDYKVRAGPGVRKLSWPVLESM